MFCSECGKNAEGKFCAHCGARLQPSETNLTLPRNPGRLPISAGASHPLIEWSRTLDYAALIAVPEVRTRIAECAAQSTRRMTGEQFLEFCDKALAPFLGISMATVAKAALPLSARLGFKTGKSRNGCVDEPPGVVLTAVLCSLARHGHAVRAVNQSADSCTIEASLPSDLWSFEGDLEITVARHDRGACVTARTRIAGQLYDWGKSHRCLEALFADLPSVRAA